VVLTQAGVIQARKKSSGFILGGLWHSRFASINMQAVFVDPMSMEGVPCYKLVDSRFCNDFYNDSY